MHCTTGFIRDSFCEIFLVGIGRKHNKTTDWFKRTGYRLSVSWFINWSKKATRHRRATRRQFGVSLSNSFWAQVRVLQV